MPVTQISSARSRRSSEMLFSGKGTTRELTTVTSEKKSINVGNSMKQWRPTFEIGKGSWFSWPHTSTRDNNKTKMLYLPLDSARRTSETGHQLRNWASWSSKQAQPMLTAAWGQKSPKDWIIFTWKVILLTWVRMAVLQKSILLNFSQKIHAPAKIQFKAYFLPGSKDTPWWTSLRSVRV